MIRSHLKPIVLTLVIFFFSVSGAGAFVECSDQFDTCLDDNPFSPSSEYQEWATWNQICFLFFCEIEET